MQTILKIIKMSRFLMREKIGITKTSSYSNPRMKEATSFWQVFDSLENNKNNKRKSTTSHMLADSHLWGRGKYPFNFNHHKNFRLFSTGMEKLSDKHARQAEKVKAVFFPIELRVPSKSENFVKREGLIQKIKNLLEKDSQTTMIDTTIFSGLGGSGKTQLAIEYVSLYHGNYEYVFWCKADNELVINNTLMHLAKFLKIDTTYSHNLRAIIKNELLKIKRSLFIFDNVDDLDQIRDIIKLPGHHVLITTRNAKDTSNPLNVSVFTEDEALEFFQKVSGIILNKEDVDYQENRDSLEEIIVLLSKHPLALAQAGNYIKAAGASYKIFHELLLKDRESFLLDNKILDPSYEHQMSVGKVLSLTFNKIQEEKDTLAIEILKYISFLHPESINLKIIRRILDWNRNNDSKSGTSSRISELNALKILKSYHMIENGNGIYKIHRLTQSIMKTNILKDAEKREIISNLTLFFKSFFSEYKRHKHSSWENLGDIINHVVCLADPENRNTAASASLFVDAGMYYSYLGNFVNAISLFKEAIECVKDRHSYDEKYVLGKANAELAILLGHMGALPSSKDALYNALITLESINCITEELAYYYTLYGVGFQFAGKFNEANDYYEKGMKIYHKLGTSEGSYLGRTLSCVAHVMAEEGNFTKAEEKIKESLRISTTVSENTFLCRIYTIAGTIFTNQGNFQEAEKYFRLAIQENEKIYKKQKFHFPYVAHTYLEYGIYQQTIGQYEHANEFLGYAFDIFKNIYTNKRNRNYIKTLIYKSNNMVLSNENVIEAENYLREATKIIKELHLEDSVDMGRIYAIYAFMKLSNNEKLSATDYLDLAQKIFEKTLLEDKNFDLANCYLLRAQLDKKNFIKNIDVALDMYGKKLAHSSFLYQKALKMKQNFVVPEGGENLGDNRPQFKR